MKVRRSAVAQLIALHFELDVSSGLQVIIGWGVIRVPVYLPTRYKYALCVLGVLSVLYIILTRVNTTYYGLRMDCLATDIYILIERMDANIRA